MKFTNLRLFRLPLSVSACGGRESQFVSAESAGDAEPSASGSASPQVAFSALDLGAGLTQPARQNNHVFFSSRFDAQVS